VVETDRRQRTPEHRFKTRAENGRAVLRSARGARRHHPRLRSAARSGRGCRRRCCRVFSVGAGGAAVDEAAELRKRRRGRAGAPDHDSRGRPGPTAEQYQERLQFELKVIEGMKYPATSHRLRLHPMGEGAGHSGRAGRGSGAGCSSPIRSPSPISTRCASILLFERFLNPERVSMPDFDIDFCQDAARRGHRLRAGALRPRPRGADHHLRHPAARGVLRDVGRVLQMPYGQVRQVCKLVPCRTRSIR